MKRRRYLFFVYIFVIGNLPGQQQLTHDVSVVNIEVPVRVYDGNTFVSHLTIDDFEIYENDVLQKVEAVYLVKKTDVVNSFSASPIEPKTGLNIPKIPIKNEESIKKRVFLLYFEMDEYPPQTSEAIEYLFENVLIETDTILVVTPVEQWKITMSAEKARQKAALAGELKSRLKKSLGKSGLPIKVWMRNLRDLAIYEADIDPVLKKQKAEEIMDHFLSYKVLNEQRFREFADFFKPVEAQKHVFIFYHEEKYSIPSEFKGYFEKRASDRNSQIDKRVIREIFSDAETTVHFLYIRKQIRAKDDVEYQRDGGSSITEGSARLGKNENVSLGGAEAADVEMNGDIFQAFRDLAVTTGGLTESTFNPVFAMKRVSDAAENYYLLYYTPTSSSADKSFKEIKVKVKSGNFRIIHRSGYVEK